MTISTDLSITTLHVNGLSVPIKRHMVAEKKKKHYSGYNVQNGLGGDRWER